MSTYHSRSVAVVGASRHRGQVGSEVLGNILASGFAGALHAVNPAAGVIQGVTSSPSLAEIADDVELAIVAVPAPHVLDVARECAAKGVRAMVVLSAGFAESGPAGAERERKLLEICRVAGIRLVGPNCLGVVDTTTGLQLAHAVLPAGDVAVLSQSGNLVLDLAGLMADRGLGVSRFVSLGNQADLGLVDFLWSCVDHDGTRAVAVYTEDVYKF